MSRPGIALLQRLFDRWQKNPDTDKKVTLALTNKVKEFRTQNAAEREELELTLKDAKRCGAVELVMGKGVKSHLLTRICLEDPHKLARFLNITPSSIIAENAREYIYEQYRPSTDLAKQTMEDILSNWYHNKGFMGLQVGDKENVVTLLKAIDAVSLDEHVGKDLRSFSATALGDSKAMESIAGLFSKIWQRHYGGDLGPVELYESMGLCKFPQPVFIKGKLRFEVAGTLLDGSMVKPYLGLAPDSVTQITASAPPDYVLTIENLASFNRHCREIDDNGIILFSSGFPSPDFCGLLTLLGTSLGNHVPFYHWGDIDLGGLRIFRRIADVLHETLNGKMLHPHLMTSKLLFDYGKETTDVSPSRYGQIKVGCPHLCGLVDSMFLHENCCLTLEQENVPPLSAS